MVTVHLLHHNCCLFPSTNTLMWRYLACRTFSKCQPYSNSSCLCKRTYIYKIHTDNQLHNCVCGVLCIEMMVLQIYLQNNYGEEWLSCICTDNFTLQWRSELLEINIQRLVQQTTLSTAHFWKGYFLNTMLDCYFVQIMRPQFLRLAVTPNVIYSL